MRIRCLRVIGWFAVVHASPLPPESMPHTYQGSQELDMKIVMIKSFTVSCLTLELALHISGTPGYSSPNPLVSAAAQDAARLFLAVCLLVAWRLEKPIRSAVSLLERTCGQHSQLVREAASVR